MIPFPGRLGASLLQAIDRKQNARLSRTPSSGWIDWHGVHRILLIETGSLADGLVTLPTLRLLRNHCSKAEIHLLASEAMASGMEGHPDADRIIALPSPLWDSKGACLAVLCRIRRRRYDLALCCSSNQEGKLLAGLSGAAHRISPASGAWDWLLTGRTAYQGNWNRVESNLDTLVQIGCEGAPGQMRMAYGFLEVKTIRAMLMGAPRPWIGFHPAPPEISGIHLHNLIEAVKKVQRITHGSILVTGSASERDTLETALATVPRSANFCGLLKPNLSQALIAEMDILITGAPAAIQMAGGVNTPTLAILDRQNSVQWPPLAMDSVLLEASDNLPCQAVTDAARALLDRVTPSIVTLTGGAGYGKAA